MFRKISVTSLCTIIKYQAYPVLFFVPFIHIFMYKKSVIRRYLLIKITNTQTLIQGLTRFFVVHTKNINPFFLHVSRNVPFNLIGGGLSLCGVVSAYFLYKIFYLTSFVHNTY